MPPRVAKGLLALFPAAAAGRAGLAPMAGHRCPRRGAGRSAAAGLEAFLEENTEATSGGSLTPEIRLRLLTPRCRFWRERAELWPLGEPYWAIYWPGGQALARYILDHPDVVRGKSVLDVGSGCGAAAIAAKMRGASRVLANDIDPGTALALNCALNGLRPLPAATRSVLDLERERWDLVLLGDMFYDDGLADGLLGWLESRPGARVLIGDPGRPQFRGHRVQRQLRPVAEYPLPEPTRRQNNGLTSCAVWAFRPGRPQRGHASLVPAALAR